MPLGKGTPPLDQLVPAYGGSVQRALLLHDPTPTRFRSRLIEQLASLVPGKDDFLNALLGSLPATKTSRGPSNGLDFGSLPI